MGTISDVGVAIQERRWQAAPKNIKGFFRTASDKVVRMKGVGRLFIFESIRWYQDTDPICHVLRFLRENPESYFLVEVCSKHSNADEREGEWDDNPWELRSNVTVALSYEVWTKCPSSCSKRA